MSAPRKETAILEKASVQVNFQPAPADQETRQIKSTGQKVLKDC